MSKKGKPFHNPFGALKVPPKVTARPAPKAVPPREEATRTPLGRLSEEDLWTMATEGADPLRDRSQRVRPKAEPITHDPGLVDLELQAYDELRELVAGDTSFAHALDPRLLIKLRRGEFAIEGRIDLHGLVREVALRALEGFLASARAAGKRCVLVVHGRGLHSPDQVPVLKEALRHWLATAKVRSQIVAYCSARQQDGGTGAAVLLLRG